MQPANTLTQMTPCICTDAGDGNTEVIEMVVTSDEGSHNDSTIDDLTPEEVESFFGKTVQSS